MTLDSGLPHSTATLSTLYILKVKTLDFLHFSTSAFATAPEL